MIAVALLAAWQVTPLHQAHSHNDYERARPLEMAMEQGFGSVEVDVFLVEGELLVSHDLPKVNPVKTLDKMYLHPLWKRHQAGQHLPNILLVDIKKDGVDAWKELKRQLSPYRAMLGAEKIQVIISGDRPRDLILEDQERWTSFDGRLPEIDLPADDRIPLISENWNSHFEWDGIGSMSSEERAKLQSLVARAHKNKRKLRFWGTPDRPEVWAVLREAGVDLIGTDQPEKLGEFLRQKERDVDLHRGLFAIP